MQIPQSNGAAEAASQASGGVKSAAELARQLIRHLGVDGATRTCRENHWDGVLTEVMSLARSHAAH